MAKKDELGRAGEERAARYLRELGCEVLDRNWRCPHGELDIVARDGGTVVIVEVKTRAGTRYGHPFEAITPQKLARLARLGREWVHQHPQVRPCDLRLDAIAIVGAVPARGHLEHLRAVQ